ncbi:MAG TPA: flagellar hook-length control protein FliK [Verrucomicrobiae bacterium]|jgi:flagellar hook-length control protein FliK|nr:flagellar hook-length control protein FliK [Verrucomicrobiae bacterium]
MIPLPIMPGQTVETGIPADPNSAPPAENAAGDFASLLLMLIPSGQTDATISPVPDGAQPTRGHEDASPEISKDPVALGFEILAAVLSMIGQPDAAVQKMSVPPQGSPSGDGATAGGVKNVVTTTTAAANPLPPFTIADAAGVATNLATAPAGIDSPGESDVTELKAELNAGIDNQGANASPVFRISAQSADLPTSTEQPQSVNDGSWTAEAEKIPAIVHELLQKTGAAQKKPTEDTNPESGVSSLVDRLETTERPSNMSSPRGLSIADARVAAHVEDAPATPTERSGFFAHDHHSAENGNEMMTHAAPAAAHTFSLQSMESDRPAAASSNHSWSAVIERLATEISTHARGERQEISLQLEPPELGHVQIQLALDGERLQARITTEFAEAGGLIQSHLQDLRQALQTHSLDLVSIQVDLGSSGFGGNLPQGSKPERQGLQPWSDLQAANSLNETEMSDSPRVASLARGALSVWA